MNHLITKPVLRMRRPRKFFRGGPTLRVFFEGREDPNNAKSVELSARQRNGWRADDGPTLNTGKVAL